MREIDFTLYVDKAATRTFGFTNDDDTVYNLTGSTVDMLLYIDPENPTTISGNIVILTGKVTFNFNSVHTDNVGVYEYVIEETKLDLSKVPLTKGNLTVKEYTPFSSTIEAYLNTELPSDINLEESYVTQRIVYWRRFLMNAFYLTESNINSDAGWPVMANALIAKLVAYDALMLATKGNLMHLLGGEYVNSTSSSGGIRRIVTGPSEVEYFPSGDTIKTLLTSGPNGSVIDNLVQDICGLANFLKVKVPMCKYANVIIGPQYYQNEDWLRITEETRVASQGTTEEETTI